MLAILVTVLLQTEPGPYCAIAWRTDGEWEEGEYVYPINLVDAIIAEEQIHHPHVEYEARCPAESPMS